MQKGERIQVLGPANGGWFKGRLESTHADGLVPVGYVHAEGTLRGVVCWCALSNSVISFPFTIGEKPDEPEKDVIVLVVKCLRDHQAADAMHLSFKVAFVVVFVSFRVVSRLSCPFLLNAMVI